MALDRTILELAELVNPISGRKYYVPVVDLDETDPDLKNKRIDLDKLLGGGNGDSTVYRAGLMMYPIEYTEGTNTYQLPEAITQENLKFIDLYWAGKPDAAPPVPGGFRLDANRTYNVDNNTFTLNTPPENSGNGLLRVWYLYEGQSNPGGGTSFDINAWLQAQANYKPNVVQTFGHDVSGGWTFFDGTTGGQTALATPTNFTATAVSSSQIDLSITAVPNATGYVYQRAADSGFSNPQTIYSGPSTTVQNVSGLTAATQYFYRVYATATGYGNSPYASANATTLAATPTNTAPTANAGPDQTITLPTNQVTLTGSASDSDGTITSYAWTKVSGTGGTITSPNAASTTVTGLTQGTYVFRFSVTDNGGLTASDDIQITVGALAYDTILIFPTATTDNEQGVTGTVAASDADFKFEFNAITPRIGLPNSMTLRIGSTDIIVLDYYADYNGQNFRFTDAAGTVRTGIFTNGTITY